MRAPFNRTSKTAICVYAFIIALLSFVFLHLMHKSSNVNSMNANMSTLLIGLLDTSLGWWPMTFMPVFQEVRSRSGIGKALLFIAILGNPLFWDLDFALAEDPIVIQKGVVQLFVDDFLIEKSNHLVRTLHQPRKDYGGERPVITLEDAETLLAKGTIVYDLRLKRYVMFAKGRPSTEIYRYTSPDGINWIGGDDGQVKPIIMDRRNPATGRVEGYGGMHSFYYDKKDAAYPYKGWVFFGNWGNDYEGIYYLRSKDGKKWERGKMVVNGYAGPGDPSCRVIRQDGRVIYGPGDTSRFTYDPIGDRFLGIFKFFTTERVGPDNGLRSRAYIFLNRLDESIDTSRIKHVELLPPVSKTNGDTEFDEYYASSVWRYGSLWLGGLQIWHKGGNYPYSAAGCAFLKLLVSRDGLHWKKVPFSNDCGIPEVFIPNGCEGGNNGRNDGGYMSEFSQGPLRIGDELIYYYGCTSYGKNHPPGVRVTGGGIFRARLRVDGFVSIDGGELITRPLKFKGRELFVNGTGPIAIHVLDKDGKVSGKTVVQGNSLRKKVKFNGQSLQQLVPRGIARLKFAVERGGKLYSFHVD